MLSFIVAFGVAKALTNLGAGALAQRVGRRRLLIAGWAAALPVPLLIAIAPSWAWIVAANVLLGINQGLAWSMTVVMKIDLVGPRRRGLALGLNEAAGYGGVALAAGLSGLLAAEFAARDVLVVAGAAIAVTAFLLSVLFVRDTAAHVALEQARHHAGADGEPPPLRERVRAAPATACRRCAPARRRGWSTTSTTASRGAWCRCSSPRTARASPRSDSSPRSTRRVERRADRHRPLVRHGRPQAADRRRHAAAGRRARGARAQRRRGRDRDRRRRAAGARHRARLPDADRRDLRRRLPGRARPESSASIASGATWATRSAALIAGIVADALGYGGAIAIVAALTAGSGLWVLYDMPTKHRSSTNTAPDRGSSPSPETARAHGEPVT